MSLCPHSAKLKDREKAVSPVNKAAACSVIFGSLKARLHRRFLRDLSGDFCGDFMAISRQLLGDFVANLRPFSADST